MFVLISSVIVKRFAEKFPAMNAEELSTNYNIPIRLVNRIVSKLLDAGIIVESISTVKKNGGNCLSASYRYPTFNACLFI